MSEDENWRRFELLAMPHLDAAYNLARWLTHDPHDAQDVVQEALLRAMRYNRPAENVALDDSDDAWQDIAAPAAEEPPAIAMRNADRQQINTAIAGLPVAYREVLVLRELEDLSYTDIARIAEIPIGTVMSRLSRARGLMRAALTPGARPQLRPVPRPAHGGGKS